MAAIPGVRVTGTIVPTDTSDVYPATDPQYGIDGWRSVADAVTRNAIPDGRRREGMVVAQQDTDQNFQLKAPPWLHTDADWNLLAGASTGTETRKIKKVVFADSPYTLLATDCQIIVDCSGGNIVLTIPTATSVKDGTNERVYHLKRLSNTPGNSLTVNRTGGDVFDTVGNGAAVTSFTMGPGDAFDLVGDSPDSLWAVT